MRERQYKYLKYKNINILTQFFSKLSQNYINYWMMNIIFLLSNKIRTGHVYYIYKVKINVKYKLL